MSAIFKRVSVRRFEDRPVEAEKIEMLLRAAMAAPSGGNQRPWQFVVVDDADLRAKLGEVSPYSQPAGRAPLDIVVIMDEQGARFPEITVQDVSACVQNILLEAVDLGLGAVWQAVHPWEEREAAVRSLLNIPVDVVPFSIVAVGYPEKTPHEQQDRYDEERVHHNVW